MTHPHVTHYLKFLSKGLELLGIRISNLYFISSSGVYNFTQ